MARLKFNGCDLDYIQNVCKARCCESSVSPSGIVVSIHPTEEETIKAKGVEVKDGLLQPKKGCKKCPFKKEDNLCGLHFTEDKPFGCIASPFTLNKNGTLIVRNRYKMLKCYNDGKKLPAYKVFRASLDLIFGKEEAERICNRLDEGSGDFTAYIPAENHNKLMHNDDIKRNSKKA